MTRYAADMIRIAARRGPRPELEPVRAAIRIYEAAAAQARAERAAAERDSGARRGAVAA